MHNVSKMKPFLRKQLDDKLKYYNIDKTSFDDTMVISIVESYVDEETILFFDTIPDVFIKKYTNNKIEEKNILNGLNMKPYEIYLLLLKNYLICDLYEYAKKKLGY